MINGFAFFVIKGIAPKQLALIAKKTHLNNYGHTTYCVTVISYLPIT